MPQRGFHCIVDFVDVSYESCVNCATTEGRCQFTASLLRGMADQAHKRDDSAISVTSLTGCVRQSYLKATGDYYQRPDYQYWAYRGTLGHTLAERGAGPETVSERRFERALALPSGKSLLIVGHPDEIVPGRRLLVDYKTTDRPPRTPSPQHVAQLNCYRWLVAPEYQIDRLGIVYLTMRGVRKVAIPVWPDGQAERFLVERAASLAYARETGQWPAMTEDTWMCAYCPVAQACASGPDADGSDRDNTMADGPALADRAAPPSIAQEPAASASPAPGSPAPSA